MNSSLTGKKRFLYFVLSVLLFSHSVLADTKLIRNNNLILTAQPLTIAVMPSISDKQINHETITFLVNDQMVSHQQIIYASTGLVTHFVLNKNSSQLNDDRLFLLNILPNELSIKTEDNKSWLYQANYHIDDDDITITGESTINHQGMIDQQTRTTMIDNKTYHSANIKIIQDMDNNLAKIVNQTLPETKLELSFRYDEQGQLIKQIYSMLLPYIYAKQTIQYIYNDKNQLTKMILEPVTHGDEEMKEPVDDEDLIILNVVSYNEQGDWTCIKTENNNLTFERKIDYYF